MNYHGLPVKECTGAKVIYYDKPCSMLCWNDTPDGTLPKLVEEQNSVILFNPTAMANNVVTIDGKTYTHCAEIPKEDDGSRFATCGELKAWLALHPTTYVVGKAFKDGFSEPRSSQAEDYDPPVEVLDKPCNDNGLFNVSGVLFVANLTMPMEPTTSNLIYGMEGLYEPSAEQIQRNESVFTSHYSVIVVEHLAVKGVNRYALGKFTSKELATRVANGIIEYLGGNISEGSKDVYVIPSASVIGMVRYGFGDNSEDGVIPAYIKSAYVRAESVAADGKEITPMQKAAMVNRLRGETGWGLMPCKRALEECDWDYDKARQEVRNLPPVRASAEVQAAEDVAREDSAKDANIRQATDFRLTRSDIAERCNEEDNPFMPKVSK